MSPARVCGAVALAWALGCGGPPGDVLLVSVDTLRADHVGLYGYERPTTPHIDRWFADAALYERAWSTDASTSPSVVSMLTGLLPQEHRVRLLYQVMPPHVAVLPDLLPESWQTAAVVSNVVLTDEAIGLATRFDHYDDFVDQREPYRAIYERNAEQTTEAALRWLRTERDPARPSFLWVHYIDPHGPYHPPADWEPVFDHPESREIDVADPAQIPSYQVEPGLTDGYDYVDRYDEEIRYLDRAVGRLLDGYAERHDVDRALIVFTADHGESMMEHERWFTHSYHVYEEIVRVPLLIRGPGVAAGRRAELASGIDVAPTVLRFAGVEPPGRLPDVDLRTGAGLGPERIVFTEGREAEQQWRAAARGSEKWMLAVPKRANAAPGEFRRYDLASDPDELAPRPWDTDDPVGRVLLELTERDPDPAGVPRRYQRGRRLAGPKVVPDLPPETLEKLRAMGYVEDDAGEPAAR